MFVGGIGVMQGNGGVLPPPVLPGGRGIHDGEALAHDPLRLSVMVEAPQAGDFCMFWKSTQTCRRCSTMAGCTSLR